MLARKVHWAKETGLRELREEVKRLKKEGKTSFVQFEGAGEGGRFEEEGKMDVDEEVDSKKKLDQRKKELQKQLRNIEKFTDVLQEVGDVLKEKWQQELQDIEQRRNDLLPGASKDAEEFA